MIQSHKSKARTDAVLLQHLQELSSAGLIRPLDYQFATVLGDSGEHRALVLLAAALASHRLGHGDVCVDLPQVVGQPLFDSEKEALQPSPLMAPDLEPWLTELSDSAFVSDGGTPAPLVLDRANRLYLGRYYRFERDLVEWIAGQASLPAAELDSGDLKRELDRLFPSSFESTRKNRGTPRGMDRVGEGEANRQLSLDLPLPDGMTLQIDTQSDAEDHVDYQRIAAVIAALHPFCVISGGPGTGKTTTVTRILALLLQLLGPLRIALAAPTGKAAARLGESLRARKPELGLAPQLLAAIPDEVVTLHRLLGMRGDGSRPRHHRDDPLHCDLLVVDEASMVDLPLMARIVAALRPAARLILLGDKDQLASVEAGSVLGDICDSGSEHRYSVRQNSILRELCGYSGATADRPVPMADGIALLRHSFRFEAASGIGELARVVNRGDAEAAVACLRDGKGVGLIWQPPGCSEAVAGLVRDAADAYAGYLECTDVAAALETFNNFRVLSALREGPFGVRAFNQALETELARRGLIDPSSPFYPGRPIMVTRNDYALKLFNGDVGLVWPDPNAGAALRAFFPLPDGTLKGYTLSRLPQHESVYAMTVHKAQGSEFRRVLLLLPVEPSPVVTRELVYTGITRAMEGVTVAATEAAIHRSLAQSSRRQTGLRERLWGPEGCAAVAT